MLIWVSPLKGIPCHEKSSFSLLTHSLSLSLFLSLRWWCTLCSSKWDRYTSQVSLSHEIWNFSLTLLTIFYSKCSPHLPNLYTKWFVCLRLTFVVVFRLFVHRIIIMEMMKEHTSGWTRIQEHNNNTENMEKVKLVQRFQTIYL